MPLINCEVNLMLTCPENCALTDTAIKDTDPNVDPPVAAINIPTVATFAITDTKLYLPVVNLSTENDKKRLEQLKTEFKRTIIWNEYRSEISNQDRNSNVNYFIDPTFTNVNRLFALFSENFISFKKYYVPKIEIKNFNMLIDRKPFLEIPVKNKEAYEAIIEISRKNDYITENLLDHEYFSKHYKLIAIDMSKKIELENPDLKQKISLESLNKIVQQCLLLLRKKNKPPLLSGKIL